MQRLFQVLLISLWLTYDALWCTIVLSKGGNMENLNKNNQFVEYALKYGVTLIEAFKDRDEPMNERSLSREWKDATGRDITKDELEEIL